MCPECDGTGQAILMNSWFTADGYRRERCGPCGGTGEGSGTRFGIPGFRKAALARIEKWGGLKPKTEPLYRSLYALRAKPSAAAAQRCIEIARELHEIEGLSVADLWMVRHECEPLSSTE